MNSSRRIWNTPFARAFGCRLPLLSAPMADVSGGLLAAEVTRAGGLGMIGAGHVADVAALEAEIAIFEERMKADRASAGDAQGTKQRSDLAIGFVGFSALSSPQGWEDYERILRTYRPKAVQFFAPFVVEREGGPSNVQLAHDYGVKFVAQLGSITEAKVAIAHDVDAIICQGSEAGGHGLRREVGSSAMALASQTAKLTDIPVLAAGGIVSGKQLAAALCVCDGASIGTRYWACEESLVRGPLQEELTRSNSCDDVIRTPVFDQIQGSFSSFKWPYPYNSTRAMRNSTTEEWDGKPSEKLQAVLDDSNYLERYRASMKSADKDVVPVLAGEGVGEINSIEGAYDVTLRMEEEAIDVIKRLQSMC
ncbi:hypothetical protein ACHAXT_010564 [Thalassiosira profunda]